MSGSSDTTRDVQRVRSGRVNIFAHWLGWLVYCWILGWKVQGPNPPYPKYVAIFAPHSSYWDMPIGLAMSFVMRIRGNWMGKNGIFRGPAGPFFRWLGGIAIERGHHHNMVEQMVAVFNHNDECVLGITPEGTRKQVEYWKSGFYQIALKANVPIVLAFLDFKRHLGGYGGVVWPTGDVEADLEKIRRFYDTITPRHESARSPIRFRPEIMEKLKADCEASRSEE